MRPWRPSTIGSVAFPFTFEHELAFSPEASAAALRELPEAPGLLALLGPAATTDDAVASQPFLTRTANLRRRAARLLEPQRPHAQAGTPEGAVLPSRRLNLRDRVARIAFSSTGSDFESLLLVYQATAAFFGLPEARRRLRLSTPFFLRFSASNPYPRLFVSNRLSPRTLGQTFGPFPSRLAAERFADAVLDLFKLRRCWEDLDVHPDHPGCAYGEMRRCLAPCNLSCTQPEYAAEAEAVRQFLLTRGQAQLDRIAIERDQASGEMDFERAAELHRQFERIKAAAALADPIVGPLPELRALVVQRAGPTSSEAGGTAHPEDAALFLLQAGRLLGPGRLSTLGVRAVREQTAVGSSLFAQPLMLGAIPLPPEPSAGQSSAPGTAANVEPASASPAEPLNSSAPTFSPTHTITPAPAVQNPEARAETALAALTLRAEQAPDLDPVLLSDHLALFRRWYFRPEKQRSGEALLPNADGSWPIRRVLNAAARTVLGDPKPMQPTEREAAKALKTRMLHPGRDGVERAVPVLGRKASKAAAAPDQPVEGSASPSYRSRRSRSSAGVPSQSPAAADKLSTP